MTDHRTRDEVGLLVVKVGGSVFSDKQLERTVNTAALDMYARAIGRLARRAPGNVIFVSGGGAFGHAAVRNLDASDPHAVLPLTEANFALKWEWTKAFRACGVPAMPLQLAAMCARESDGSVEVADLVLRRLLDCGILPVLSGDAIVVPDGSLQVLGSDKVPGALLGVRRGPVRIVALTDVPGILVDGPGGSEVLRELNADEPSVAAAAIWDTPAWDTSNSMAGKLAALLDCARRGAECFILNAAPRDDTLGFLLDPVEDWPPEILYTRISRFSVHNCAAPTAKML